VKRRRSPAPDQLDRPTQLEEVNMKQFNAPMIVVLTTAVAASATAETTALSQSGREHVN
jgi:hypothetical protein